jgi:hypothetical protein
MEAMLEAALGAGAPVVAAAVEPPAVAVAVEPVPAAVVAPVVAAVMAQIAADAPPPVMAVIVPDETIGCKLDVWKGRASRTRGGLMKQHLKLNRIGTVVSIKASDAAKRNNNLGNFQFPLKP